jgi:hypothetical protein
VTSQKDKFNAILHCRLSEGNTVLKVVGNEKIRWVKMLTVVRHYSETVGQPLSFFFLHMPVAIQKSISVSALSS